MLSGAVMNPKALRELVPDFEQQGFPTEYVCNYAGFWIFHPKGKLNVPIVPPELPQEGLPRGVAFERRQVAGGARRGRRRRHLSRLRGRPAPDRGRARRRRAHRRHGHRSPRQAEGELPAGHGHLRQGHGDRRRRARHAREAADRALRSRRAESADLRDGRQGDLADRPEEARPGPRRARHAVPRDPEAASTACGCTT